MSEEIIPAPVVKPKQFLLMLDETTLAYMGKIIPGIQGVEVEGLSMKDNDTHALLVNPLPKPKEVA